MAEFTGPDYKTLQANGQHGNARVAILKYEAAGEAAASILKLGKQPGAAFVYDVVCFHDDLGTGNTIDVGFRYVTTADGTSDDNYWFDNKDTATAGARTVSAAEPVLIADGNGVEIIVTTAGAAVTGTIYVIVAYDWVGQ